MIYSYMWVIELYLYEINCKSDYCHLNNPIQLILEIQLAILIILYT